MSHQIINKLSIRSILRLLFIVALLLSPSSCGGGTGGTGGLTVSGTLSQAPFNSLLRTISSSTPLGGITVTVDGTGDSDVTDDSGNFVIPTSINPSEVVLRFTGSDFESSYTVTNIPTSTALLTVKVHLDNSTKFIKGDEEDFSDKDGNDIEQRPGH